MFSPFERMVAWRYLRSKKAEGFVSVIAGFSFAGIMLGVATLIIVMSVMNGFEGELKNRMLTLLPFSQLTLSAQSETESDATRSLQSAYQNILQTLVL